MRQSWHYDRNYENIHYVTTVNCCDGNIAVSLRRSDLRFHRLFAFIYDFKHIRNNCSVAYMGDRFEKQGGSLRNSGVTPTYLNAVSKEVRDRKENEDCTDCERY